MYNVDDMSKFNINPQTGELTPKNAQTVNSFSAFIGDTDIGHPGQNAVEEHYEKIYINVFDSNVSKSMAGLRCSSYIGDLENYISMSDFICYKTLYNIVGGHVYDYEFESTNCNDIEFVILSDDRTPVVLDRIPVNSNSGELRLPYDAGAVILNSYVSQNVQNLSLVDQQIFESNVYLVVDGSVTDLKTQIEENEVSGIAVAGEYVIKMEAKKVVLSTGVYKDIETSIFNIGRPEKVESVWGLLSLKEGDYYAEIADGSVIELPKVERFAKVTLWFKCDRDISITFPEVAWQNEPESNAGYIYEYIFTYIPEFGTWVGGFVSYEVI